MRIIIRTSKRAVWARRIASLSVPLLVIPTLLFRFGHIEAQTFYAALGVAFVTAVASVIIAVIALVHLWKSGDLGWGRSISALFIGMVCLAPFGWAVLQIERYPRATDVATAPRQDLPLVLDAVTRAMPDPQLLSASVAETAFPNARTRDYPLTAEQTYELIERLVDQWGWQVRLARPPSDLDSGGRLNARSTSLIGWRDEIVIRITSTSQGARVDMRSVSLDAIHDLGANGQRIEAFLASLDAEVTTLLRDNPNIAQPVIDDAVEISPPLGDPQ